MTDVTLEENEEPITLEMIFGLARQLRPGKGDHWVFKMNQIAQRALRKSFRDLRREKNRTRFMHGKHTQRARRAR